MKKLAEFAQRIEFRLEIDPVYLRDKIRNGVPNDDKADRPFKIAAREINESITTKKPYDHSKDKHFPHSWSIPNFTVIFAVFGKFLQHDEIKYVESTTGLFSVKDKLKLIDQMLLASTRQGGCGLDINNLIYHKQMRDCFPLHDRVISKQLLSAIFDWRKPLWHIPFFDIKEYLGEKIGLFNVFIAHYTQWLVVPSVIGLAFQFVVWATNVKTFSSPVLPFYSILVTVWGITMLEFWKRRQSTVAMWWGTTDYEQVEIDRPEFLGIQISSYINGLPMLYVTEQDLLWKLSYSCLIVSSFLMLMMGSLAAIYTLRYSLQNQIDNSEASYIASALTTALILTLNMIYQVVAKRLTDNENLRTDTQYEDSLSVKIFVFQFINSYASFFFLAFVAAYLPRPNDSPANYPGQCGAETCMQPLAINLGIVYGMRLTFTNILDIVVPYIQYTRNYRKETRGVSTKRNLSRPEEEALLMP